MRVWALSSVIPMLVALFGKVYGKLTKKGDPPWALSSLLTGLILVGSGMIAEQISGCQEDGICAAQWGWLPLRIAISVDLVVAAVLIFKAWNRTKEVMPNDGTAQTDNSTDAPASRRPRTGRRLRSGP